ncbi:hypothetical protein [Paraburkholderia atlantica]|uniref:hypothetical protein n=1 Tax=Paraburkholderia atlantica TaxID=2654982 RepID=UPI00160B681F|nr:hypothetical protein [Paraburkholderia atlantica]MBB5508106.1 hypothetical protein [Paraburkholderia atlantica]
MSAQASPYQISLLQHTLGLSERRREPYRNHFVAGHGHSDMRDLEALEQAGLMERRPSPKFLDAGDIVFAATDAGREAAIAALPEPTPSAKRSRYQEYLDADGCAGDSFTEFLCGRQFPIFESRRAPFDQKGDRFGYQHRMYRLGKEMWCYARDVEGEWCATMKDAKASYKAALKASKQRRAA